MMYLLDTNICIFLIRNKLPYLKERLIKCDPDQVFLSAVTVAELEYGASKSLNREKNREALLKVCASFGNILDFSNADAEAYGIIRAYLERIGSPIGPYDMQIAAQAMTRNLTVVTHNYDEFSRIPWIRVEDWTKE